ncbi:hypothetical protein RI528_00060 [Aeromonas veronii]|uniref:hypothetical protein n=2 Tax=Aeromonas TaxID=642 RepID=UPI0034453276
MNLSSDNGLSRYKVVLVGILLLTCKSVTAGVDDVWNAAPPTYDTAWAQQWAGSVIPANNGGEGAKYKIFTYRGDWGSAADFGWHHWCALTAHTANGDRGTGWNVHATSFDPSTSKSYWRVTYYNLSSWGATCYDVL